MAKTKRTALITGSGRNIGRACALALAADGINLVVNGSRNQDACEQTAAMARELGVKAKVAMGDMGQEVDAHKIADEAIMDLGAVDILAGADGRVHVGVLQYGLLTREAGLYQPPCHVMASWL